MLLPQLPPTNRSSSFLLATESASCFLTMYHFLLHFLDYFFSFLRMTFVLLPTACIIRWDSQSIHKTCELVIQSGHVISLQRKKYHLIAAAVKTLYLQPLDIFGTLMHRSGMVLSCLLHSISTLRGSLLFLVVVHLVELLVIALHSTCSKGRSALSWAD